MRVQLKKLDCIISGGIPIDDEPYTDEERTAVEEGRKAVQKGDVITSEELRKELGIRKDE